MATGTKLMQEISDQFLNCKICEENFKDPKTLACLHTFCQACLQERHDTEATTRSGRYSIYLRHVTCPLCEKKTELPSGGVRRLPNNFLVSNLTDVLAKRTETSTTPPCEICGTVKGKTVNASNKCLDCCKLLCSSCVDLHRSTKVTQHHSLIDLQEEKNIQCKVHEEEQVRYYCTPCDACICVVCAFQDHRDHDVCSFNEVSDQHKHQLEDLLTQCRGRLHEVSSRLESIQKQEVAVRKAKETIRDLSIEYIAQVRTRERELMKQLDELCGGDVHKLSDGKTALQEYRSDLESSCCLTEVMLRQRGVELMVVKGDIEAKMTGLLKPALPEVSTDADLTELNFVPGQVALGKISLKDENSETPSGLSLTQSDMMTNGSVINTPDVINSPSIETKETYTTMIADMKVVTSHSDSQTDQNTNSFSNSKIVETIDRGVAASVFNMRARGTMTERSDVRSLKCQTDTTARSESRLSLSGKDSNLLKTNSPNDQTTESSSSLPRQDSQQVPDLLPTTTRLYTPGRRVWSRRMQTDISSLGVEGLSDLSNEDFVKLMTLTQKQEDETPAPTRRPRRVRTKECGITTEPTEPPPHIQTFSVHTQSDEPPKVIQTDQETSTPTVLLESRGVWTDQMSTCDRASDAIWPKQQDRAVGTVAVRKENFSQQANPKTSAAQTNTVPEPGIPQETQTDQIEKPIENETKKQEVKTQDIAPENTISEVPSQASKMCDRGSDAISIPKPSKATETFKVRTSTAATETTAVKLMDKDVATVAVKTIEQWTETFKPQMVSTGVAPPRPVTQDVGMSTIAVLTNEEATCTELKLYRDTHTEMVISVCDQETVTDTQVQYDAQTGMDFATESEGCGTDVIDNTEEASMTDMSQMDTTEEDVTFFDTNTTIDTNSPSKPCALCGHVSKNGKAGSDKQSLPREDGHDGGQGQKNTDSKYVHSTQDVGTMAMSCVSCRSPLQDMGVQTANPRVYDKASSTSFDWENEEFMVRPLSREYLDVATSTESLPYIGLLSEIDVDELIVIPEAAFELVSDSESDTDQRDVVMVDEETSMEYVQCVEEGTQTRGLEGNMTSSGHQMTESGDRKAVGEVIRYLVSQNSTDEPSSSNFAQSFEKDESNLDHDADKNLVSIGVNTIPKLTFEKETCTPLRHLFSKGTMTFYVSKMDKSTSMLSQRASLELCKSRSVDKVTMTTQTDRKDIGVETDCAKMDGRITDCISKLRNVSERLTSPTAKKESDDDGFFGDNFTGISYPQQSKEAGSNTTEKHELARQRQVKNLLGLPDGPVIHKERKPQPITTLKGRRPVHQRQGSLTIERGRIKQSETIEDKDRTQSLPRRFPGDRTGVVRMGSQPLYSSRLPLLRYNSAPGRIATVPTQTLINKCTGGSGFLMDGPVPRPVSPSKIPVTTKKSPPEHNPSSDDKPQFRRPLPSITETRNSTCSDSSNSSFISATSPTPVNNELADEGFAPELCSTPKMSHKPRFQMDTLSVAFAEAGGSRPPSACASVSPTASNSSLDKLSNPDTTRSSSDTLDCGKHENKKEKKSFMQRLLSKKKKNSDSKKSDKKPIPPVCVPAFNSSDVAASMAKAPLPQAAAQPEPQTQHWPNLQLPPHHYRPEPVKPASPPRKPRPFVIVNQRVVPIQQDNVEEVAEKIERRRASLDQSATVASSAKTSPKTGPKEKRKERECAAPVRAPQRSPKVQEKNKKTDKAPVEKPKSKRDTRGRKTLGQSDNASSSSLSSRASSSSRNK